MSDPILDLLAAPPSPSLSVDEDAVYAGGRRRLRRRTLRRTGFGLGAAAAATAVAFAVVGTGVGNETLPAGPSPTGATSTRATSAELFDGTYAVEVIPGAPADQPNVKFYKVDNGKRSLLAGSSADANVVSMGTGTGADGVMLGTAPAGLAKSLTIAPGAKGGVAGDEAPLPGTDYKAIALKFDTTADVDTYRDTIWMDDSGSGIVRDAMGNRLPSMKMPEAETFFLARDKDLMGIFTRDGGYTSPLGGKSTPTMTLSTKPDEGYAWDVLTVAVLPLGVTDGSFTWEGATDEGGASTSSDAALGASVMWARAAGVGSGQAPRVTSVTWTDKAGTRHTDKVN